MMLSSLGLLYSIIIYILFLFSSILFCSIHLDLFYLIRLTLILHYKVVSYSNLLFTCKNTLVITLQLYRLMILLCARIRIKKSGGGCFGRKSSADADSAVQRPDEERQHSDGESGRNRNDGSDDESDAESQVRSISLDHSFFFLKINFRIESKGSH